MMPSWSRFTLGCILNIDRNDVSWRSPATLEELDLGVKKMNR